MTRLRAVAATLRAVLGRGGSPETRAASDVRPDAQHVFQTAVDEGRSTSAAEAFGENSSEYRRRFWNKLAALDHQHAIAGRPAGEEAEFMDSGRTILEWVREYALCDERSDVLDIGCGVGRLAVHVAPLVRTLRAIDVSDEMVAKARERLRRLSNVVVERTDGESLRGFADASFDLVYSILVLQHMDRANCRRMFGEVARVLRPGGKALIQLPWEGSAEYTSAYETEPQDSDLWYARVYSEDDLRALFVGSGLTPIVVRVADDGRWGNLWGVAERPAR